MLVSSFPLRCGPSAGLPIAILFPPWHRPHLMAIEVRLRQSANITPIPYNHAAYLLAIHWRNCHRTSTHIHTPSRVYQPRSRVDPSCQGTPFPVSALPSILTHLCSHYLPVSGTGHWIARKRAFPARSLTRTSQSICQGLRRLSKTHLLHSTLETPYHPALKTFRQRCRLTGKPLRRISLIGNARAAGQKARQLRTTTIPP